MRLDVWLREEHSLEAKLRVIERLCQAVNSVHDDGEALAALEPARVEIGSEGRCDLSAALEGSPAPAYSPPDREASPSPAATDIYAAGAIVWEMLAGRPPGASPQHLAEVRPGLDRELVNAVMACLEPAGEWRPRDLTYLAQMAAARQKRKAVPPPGGPRAPLPPRRLAPRPGRRGPRRRSWPLLAALVLVMALAFVAGRRLLGPGDAQAPPVRPIPPAAPAATPTPLPSPTAPEPAVVEPPATTTALEGPPFLAPAPDRESRPLPTREALPTPTPPLSAPTPPPATGQLVTPPRPDPGPPPATSPGPPPSTASPARSRPPSAEPPAPPEAPPTTPGPPPELTAVSPLEVKGPGKVLIDLHGRGFRSMHRARVLPVQKVPWGISVVRQKLVSDSLITVLLELNESVEPGEYALAVEDGLGTRSEPVTFEVTR